MVAPNAAQVRLLRRAVENGEARTLDGNEQASARVLARLGLATTEQMGQRTLAVRPTDEGRRVLAEINARHPVVPLRKGDGAVEAVLVDEIPLLPGDRRPPWEVP